MICLNMIVKNESRVILRSLSSVKRLIDYWVIVDTGSSDGTQQIVKEYLKEIPGELHERPWVNFGHNRNEALELARDKGDYLLFLDADDRLLYDEGFAFPSLKKDYYMIHQRWKDQIDNIVILLLRNDPDFRWTGVLHEILRCKTMKEGALLEGITNEYYCDGARSQDPQKYAKEAEMLEKGLLEEPENSRYVFYLAQTYKAAQNYPLALHNYERRGAMGGPDPEVFFSLYYRAVIHREIKSCPRVVIEGFCSAYLQRPHRVEPLFDLAQYLQERGYDLLGWLVAKYGEQHPLLYPDDMFVEAWKYQALRMLADSWALNRKQI